MNKARFKVYRNMAPKYENSIYPKRKAPVSDVVNFVPKAQMQTECEETPQKRWKAELRYQDAAGSSWSEVSFEEIMELHGIIEHGPDWNTLVSCTVTLNREPPSIRSGERT